MPDSSPISCWHDSLTAAVQNIQRTNPADICTYPIPALNKVLGGIGRGEVVVIAGQSGEGKSDLLRLISEENAQAGRIAHVYQFEMDSDENVRRFLLRRLNAVRAAAKLEPVTPVDLFFNRIGEWDHQRLAEIIAEEGTKNLPLFSYNGQSLTVAEFLVQISADLPHIIILDHIHYFSGEGADNENEALSKAMREIRQWVKTTGVPIVLAAHMRKPGNKKADDQTPHDIYGSSNIFKEASTCIILRRRYNETTFSVWKSRIGAEYKRFEVAYDTACKMWVGEAKNERSVFDGEGVEFQDTKAGTTFREF